MEILSFGDKDAPIVLIQPVNDYDLDGMEEELSEIKKTTKKDSLLLGVKVDDWNDDLSPWKTKNIFGKGEFAGRAEDTLAALLPLTKNAEKTYYIGGYSLAGLFALWAATKTDVFSGVAAASPSTWYEGFTDYLQDQTISVPVYLSLGKLEERAKLPLLAQTADKIRQTHRILQSKGTDCTLVFNEGNHFFDTHKRTANAFSFVMTR